MKRIKISFLLIFLTSCFFWLNMDSALAQEPVILKSTQEKYPLGMHLEYLEDPEGKLTIDEVTSKDYEAMYIPSNEDIPVIGFNESAYWIRIRVRNESMEQADWRLVFQPPYIDFIDLYSPESEVYSVSFYVG